MQDSEAQSVFITVPPGVYTNSAGDSAIYKAVTGKRLRGNPGREKTLAPLLTLSPNTHTKRESARGMQSRVQGIYVQKETHVRGFAQGSK